MLILVVLIVGSLYALPNLYPTQPSIQVAYTDSGASIDKYINKLDILVLIDGNCNTAKKTN